MNKVKYRHNPDYTSLIEENNGYIVWEDDLGSHKVKVIRILGEGKYSQVFLGEDDYAYAFTSHRDVSKVLLAEYSLRYPEDENILQLEILETFMAPYIGLIYLCRSKRVLPASIEDCTELMKLTAKYHHPNAEDPRVRIHEYKQDIKTIKNRKAKSILQTLLQLDELLIELDISEWGTLDIHCDNIGILDGNLVIIDSHEIFPKRLPTLMTDTWATNNPIYTQDDLFDFALPTILIETLIRTKRLRDLTSVISNRHLTQEQRMKILNTGELALVRHFADRRQTTPQEFEIILGKIKTGEIQERGRYLDVTDRWEQPHINDLLIIMVSNSNFSNVPHLLSQAEEYAEEHYFSDVLEKINFARLFY